MNLGNAILRRAAAQRRRIAFCEPGDPRTLEAAARLAEEGIVEPILVGDPGRAMALVRDGNAEGVVAGLHDDTADLVTLWDAHRVGSSFALIELEQRTEAGDSVLAFADMGLVADPDPERLAEIARGTAFEFHRLVGAEPRVAMLSFSTHRSASHAAIEAVRRATELAREADPDLAIDGELQADAALVSAVAEKKAVGSAIAGRANVLIFPDSASSTIAAALVGRYGRCRTLGPFLRGLELPANRVSPQAGADDIVLAAAVTALQAG